MKKQFLRIVTASLLTVLLTALSSFGVHANDFTYFNGLAGCDNDYFGTLSYYRSDPNYPVNPTEQDSVWAAQNDYFGCTLRLPQPAFEIDFCTRAMEARDNCFAMYYEDFGTYGTCVNASGIHHCQ